MKQESDVGAANIPALVELVNAAVGHVALAFYEAAALHQHESVANEHVSVLVGDSQTSGAQCPAHHGHISSYPYRNVLLFSVGRTHAVRRCATYLLDTRRPRVLRRCASSLVQPPTAHKT